MIKTMSLFFVNQFRGLLTYKDSKGQLTELTFCQPIDTTCKILKKKNPDWTPSSSAEVPQWLPQIHFESNPSPFISITPQHFSLLSKLLDRHLPRLLSFIDELMTYADKAEQRRGTRSGIIFDEDVLDEARGIAIRSYSVDAVKAMLREVEKTKKDLVDAVNVQSDISKKYIELQMQHQELQKKYDSLEKRTTDYEQGVIEMQNKLNELKFKLKI